MGGNAFPNLHTPRMSPLEYGKVRDKYIRIVERFYDKVVCPHESPGKVDYGDVDLVVSGPFPDFSSLRLCKALGAVEQTKTATLTSFAVPFDREGETVYAQVDVLLCAEDCLDWEIWMGAYGDLSQIIGFLVQSIGLTMTNRGLWIKVPEAKGSNQEAAMLFLTKNPVEARRFLGLDEENYQKGFTTVEEMFHWSSKGKCLLQVPATQIKAKKRKVFNDFHNWAIHNQDLWASKARESREDVLKLAIATFNVQEQYRLLIERPRKFNEIVAAVGDPRKRSIPRSFTRWVGFQEDGSPILLPVDQDNGHAESNQDDWLDKIVEDRLPQFLAWIEANRTEIERKEKVWIAQNSLEKKLAHFLDQLPETGRHDFELSLLNFKRFDKELSICQILGSACEDENLLKQYNSCEELISEYRVHSYRTFPLGSDPHMVKIFHSIWTETVNALFFLRGSIDRPIFSACLDLTLSLKDNLGLLWDRVDQIETRDDKGGRLGYVTKSPRTLVEIKPQDLEQRLIGVLVGLPMGRRKVFNPFDFNSDQYTRELQISYIIDRDLRLQVKDLNAFRYIHQKPFRALFLPEENTEDARSAFLLTEEEMEDAMIKQKIKQVNSAQRMWTKTQAQLRNKRELITPMTFKSCQDRVRQILLHLSIYTRSLTKEDQVVRSSGMLTIQTLGIPFSRPGLEDSKEKVPGERKHREGQADFRNELITYYDCLRTDDIWCPVLGEWVPRTECTAAHIVPYSFPPHLLNYLLYPEDSKGMYDEVSAPTMVPQNGLYLYRPIENALDDGKLIIVPRLVNDDSVDFQVQLLDESLQDDNATFEFNCSSQKWQDLDGKSLEFRNGNRPAKHLLYLHILLTVVRKCIYQTPGWAYRLESFIEAKDALVLTPHPHLIESPLMRLTKLITDATVFKEVQATIPMVPAVLPHSYSKEDIEEVDEEFDNAIADLYALVRTDSEDEDDLFGPGDGRSEEQSGTALLESPGHNEPVQVGGHNKKEDDDLGHFFEVSLD